MAYDVTETAEGRRSHRCVPVAIWVKIKTQYLSSKNDASMSCRMAAKADYWYGWIMCKKACR